MRKFIERHRTETIFLCIIIIFWGSVWIWNNRSSVHFDTLSTTAEDRSWQNLLPLAKQDLQNGFWPEDGELTDDGESEDAAADGATQE